MKKAIITVFTIVMLSNTGTVFGASGFTQNEIHQGITFCKEFPVTLKLNNRKVENQMGDASPIIIAGRTLIPARNFFEAMGAVVKWNSGNQSVNITYNEDVIALQMQNQQAYVNGEAKKLEVPAMIIDPDGDGYGSAMVPIRFISENLDAKVTWEQSTRTVQVIMASSDERAYPDLQAMLDAARAEGLSPIICSSFRTMDKQKALFSNQVSKYISRGYSATDAEAEAAKWVAIPGTSEHQTGLAVDIVALSYQLLNREQEKTAEQKWLMKNCYKYGFILRYPSNKSDITGIGYEPWHYRYVGKAAAKEILEQGICLEEYLLLR